MPNVQLSAFSIQWMFTKRPLLLSNFAALVQGRQSGVIAQCHAGATRTQEPYGIPLSRRSTLGVSALVAIQLSTNAMVAEADVVRDLAAQVLIPDVDLQEALVAMLDARAVLLYVKVI